MDTLEIANQAIVKGLTEVISQLASQRIVLMQLQVELISLNTRGDFALHALTREEFVERMGEIKETSEVLDKILKDMEEKA